MRSEPSTSKRCEASDQQERREASDQQQTSTHQRVLMRRASQLGGGAIVRSGTVRRRVGPRRGTGVESRNEAIEPTPSGPPKGYQR
jgi:hypothetical protein